MVSSHDYFADKRNDKVKIYINGKFIESETFTTEPNGFTIYNSPVVIGHNHLTGNPGFRGELYALNIKNYFVENQYFLSKINTFCRKSIFLSKINIFRRKSKRFVEKQNIF